METGKFFQRLILVFVSLLWGLSFASSSRPGTTGMLTGQVVEKGTQAPLAGLNIILVGTRMGAATDVKGRFFITNIPAGVYAVRATMIGYVACVVENVRIVMDLKTQLTIEMEPRVLELGEEIVVTAERPLIQPDVTATTHSISGSKIEELPVDSFKDEVMLQPGVTADGHIRGGRETEALYLVDGLPIQDAMAGGQGSDLPNGSIVEMTVQTGGFNAEYGTPCPVSSMWSPKAVAIATIFGSELLTTAWGWLAHREKSQCHLRIELGPLPKPPTDGPSSLFEMGLAGIRVPLAI